MFKNHIFRSKTKKEISNEKSDTQIDFKEVLEKVTGEVDYVSAIADITTNMTRDNDTIATAMSTIAVKAQHGEEDMCGAIERLNVVSKKAENCIQQLLDIIEENQQMNDSLKGDFADISQKVLNIFNEMNENNANIMEQMIHFTETAKQSSQYVKQLRDITSEINLVALNASIEAARAGESGRGFAVVAEEVQKLANQSEKCTTEFANAIEHINQGAIANQNMLSANNEALSRNSETISQLFQDTYEGIVEKTDGSIAVYKSLNNSLRESTNDMSYVTSLMQDITSVFKENSSSIAAMCELQVQQTSNMFEVEELAKQLKERKIVDIKELQDKINKSSAKGI